MSSLERQEPPDTVLDVRNLSVSFGDAIIFRHVSFQVPRGTSLAVIGPNGSGKTVLFRTLIGSLPVDGEVRWAPDVRIGYVPQKLDIERDIPITGLDFLRARAALAHAPESDIYRVLELVDVARKVGTQPIGTLSGGQFQRLLVAFALVGNPNVLLLDEPTAGVDEPGQERMNEMVHRLQRDQGLSVLFISHELNIVHKYATNVLCLSRDTSCVGPPMTILTPDRLHEVYGAQMEYHVHDH